MAKESSVKTDKKENTSPEEITIDAKGRALGRVASEAAMYLQEKHTPQYEPHRDVGTTVRIKNVKGINMTGNKRTDKIYWRHSGYPGGIYGRNFEEMFQQDPARVMRIAVRGMLPKNRLTKPRLKRLILEE